MAQRTMARHRRRLLAALATACVAALPLQALGTAPASAAAPSLVDDPASLVNPLIGTSGAVDTFPGPDAPYGMLQWSPDTTPKRPDGGGYEYTASKISGYSLTHISGPGCPAGGDVPILPYTGALSGDLSAVTTGFEHADENVRAGYYGLTDDAGITTELTTRTRAGLARFTFPDTAADGTLLLKLSGGATKIDGTRAQVVGDREVIGAVDSGHFCGAANTYTLHFDIKFDRPFAETGTWTGSTVNPDARSLERGAPKQHLAKAPTTRPSARHSVAPRAAASGAQEPPVTGANGMYLRFATGSRHAVKARVGISYTSDDGAKTNLAREMTTWDLKATEKATHDDWNRLLGRVRIGGGSHDQQVQFYTALYHSLLHPNVFSDADGRYAGMDRQTHRTARAHTQYANYSGWDTYRSQTQLMAMVDPDTAGDVVRSMLNGYDQTGLLPKWAQNNGESYVMVGDPAAGIISGAHAFGARGYDTGKALDALVHEATHPNNDRPGMAIRDKYGYLPIDESGWGCCNFYGPVSTLLEYDSADYAIAAMAKRLGRDATYTKFATRAQDWQNVFNPQTGYVQAKKKNGEFATGFAPGTSNGMVEGTAAQYTPMVPFNIKALVAARGGAEAYADHLDSLLDSIDDPGSEDADLSNEPSVEIPWQYDYVGQPWKAQAAVREAQRKLYFNAPVGQFGNDDLGAMSSWYVWSELGMYPETPGTDTLALGSPVFPRAEVRLGHGRTLAINAPQAADDAPYVQSLKVRGKDWDKPWVAFGALSRGGTLDYTLGTRPDTSWGTAPSAAPPSDGTGEHDVLASAGPSGAGLVLAPGKSGTGTLDLVNIGASNETVSWTADVPAGMSADPASGSVDLAPGDRTAVEVTITAGTDEGAQPVAFHLEDASGASLGTAVLHVAVAKPGAMWPYYTNAGAYADGASFTGGFDGGGWAYSATALTAAGATPGAAVTADGITYTWPDAQPGEPDNIEAAGQTVPVTAPSGAASLGLLGSATNAGAAGAGGDLKITYTDGSSTTAKVVFSDWTLGGGGGTPVPGNTTALTTPYRNTDSGGRDGVKTYVFSVKLPLDPAKQVASIGLPVTSDGTVHVFAFGYGT